MLNTKHYIAKVHY